MLADKLTHSSAVANARIHVQTLYSIEQMKQKKYILLTLQGKRKVRFLVHVTVTIQQINNDIKKKLKSN